MPTAQYGVSLSIGGVSISKVVNRTGDHPNSYEVSLPAGKAGTLTTRTDADTGEATMSTGHGITTGQIVDVYWDGGVRYGISVGTVSTNQVPLEGGAGDDLPADETAIVVTPQVTINTAIDGDAVEIAGLLLEYTDSNSTGKGHVLFEDAAGDDIAEIDLTANTPRVYDIEGGDANPFTGDAIAVCKASNGSSSAAATLKIVSLEDSTP